MIPEALLGTGGMGVVYLARQPALARSVALKSVAPEHHADAALTGALVREAQVTGALEHPNIVPVYDIRRDEAGRPQIILRKIEGLEWGVLMEDAAELARRFDVGDPLEWHLRVLIQVCNGISFAHSRGVLHRDLKPENVMIGAFGEVYILDWGIAAGVVGTEGAALCGPPVEGEVAGTPGYMAPEMLEGDASQQSPRTDVYLLGGLLHEILVGEPPHVGDSLTEVVERTLAGVTDLPVDTPPTLARLCARALARDPDDRPESAAAFRRALERYLRTRHVDRLMAEANARLAALERALARGGARGQDDHAIYNLFGQCRFGFQLALAASPGDKTARVGSRRAVEAMVRHELQRDNAAAAAAFASGVELSSELRARIDAQLAQAQ
ncbi:MAG: serine/threonine protein kinase, partial [Myxococcales bacterium]|nr:serine/threonine protein kinase [Myxococcales bacterium]